MAQNSLCHYFDFRLFTFKIIFSPVYMHKFFFAFLFLLTSLWAQKQPNVIIVLTDDQGYGDFGCKGNPIIKTPHLDAMAARSFEMKRFYVSPVCSPTRASLMTGRDFYRTGVTDTFKGRSIMRNEEITLPEILKETGYSTGLFGKWHLGDNYPTRPMDQGFDHALYHMGGGLGQPSEPKENERRYTDAILFENGVKTQTKGYCCDVYFDEAIKWFKKQHQNGKPFFAYIASNTPHSPYHDVPQKWLDYYSKIDLSPKNFPQTEGHPIPDKPFNQDTVARVYAMVSNIDDNMGKLFKTLEKEALINDTIVIFFNDNGPNTIRYVGGFSDKKGSHKEAGIRSPIWWHWPNKLQAGGASDLITAHIDIMPTLVELCGAKMPAQKKIDGRSIAKTLLGGKQSWDDRHIFLQWHRGDKPESLNNTAIVQQNWKIESSKGITKLFDMKKDPFAQHDVTQQFPEKTSQLLKSYQGWLDELDREYPNMWEPRPIEVNPVAEPDLFLTRQEWRTFDDRGRQGGWYLKFNQNNTYQISFNLKEANPESLKANLFINDKKVKTQLIKSKNGQYRFSPFKVNAGNNMLKITTTLGDKEEYPWHVFMQKIN